MAIPKAKTSDPLWRNYLLKLRATLSLLAAVTFLGVTSFASSYGPTSSATPYASGHGHHALPPTANDSVLYDNGPDDGQIAYTINFGYSVTNSFNLAAASTLNSASFSNWLFPGDTASSVDWSITTAPFGGTTVGSGTASLSGVFEGNNSFGYDVYEQTFSLGGLNLGAGRITWSSAI